MNKLTYGIMSLISMTLSAGEFSDYQIKCGLGEDIKTISMNIPNQLPTDLYAHKNIPDGEGIYAIGDAAGGGCAMSFYTNGSTVLLKDGNFEYSAEGKQYVITNIQADLPDFRTFTSISLIDQTIYKVCRAVMIDHFKHNDEGSLFSLRAKGRGTSLQIFVNADFTPSHINEYVDGKIVKNCTVL